jgi:hypothetical protein
LTEAVWVRTPPVAKVPRAKKKIEIVCSRHESFLQRRMLFAQYTGSCGQNRS